ncbi:hypothetical protein E2C01_088044 [Portunus trituberculatus]|uniref:Uncharacterized protein n=1 Tax=Portunus trituberculatus TaxID=210409 RepID=A0A5B7J532_PORTR|nr:hypothetical protein [Portunus trituberculatus]
MFYLHQTCPEPRDRWRWLRWWSWWHASHVVLSGTPGSSRAAPFNRPAVPTTFNTTDSTL